MAEVVGREGGRGEGGKEGGGREGGGGEGGGEGGEGDKARSIFSSSLSAEVTVS